MLNPKIHNGDSSKNIVKDMRVNKSQILNRKEN